MKDEIDNIGVVEDTGLEEVREEKIGFFRALGFTRSGPITSSWATKRCNWDEGGFLYTDISFKTKFGIPTGVEFVFEMPIVNPTMFEMNATLDQYVVLEGFELIDGTYDANILPRTRMTYVFNIYINFIDFAWKTIKSFFSNETTIDSTLKDVAVTNRYKDKREIPFDL